MNLRAPKPLHEASFDLTPMIDIVLLLIIFFMFTSHFAKSQLTPMDLPQERGEPQRDEAEGAAIIIDLDREGRLKILGEPVTPERLSELLKLDLANKKVKTSVTIRAERLCPAAHLNRLAVTLMGLGVRDWKLATANVGGNSTAPASSGGVP